MSIQDAILIVEEAIKCKGVDPSTIRIPPAEGVGWILPADRTALFINLSDHDGLAIMRITSPILFMPPEDLLPFYRRILELNAQAPGISLGMERDVVCVYAQQVLDGITSSTVNMLMDATFKALEILPEMIIYEFQSTRFWTPK